MTYFQQFVGSQKCQPLMRVDLVYDQNGDWAALYVDGVLRFQGHSIRDDDWKTVLTELGVQVNDYAEASFEDGAGAPDRLEDLEING